jgi:hypothetical protein
MNLKELSQRREAVDGLKESKIVAKTAAETAAVSRAALNERVKTALKTHSNDAGETAKTAALGAGYLDTVHEMLIARENKDVDDQVADYKASLEGLSDEEIEALGGRLSDEQVAEIRASAVGDIKLGFLGEVKDAWSGVSDRAASDQNAFDQLLASFDKMEPNEHDAVAEALKTGGPEALTEFHRAREARIHADNKDEVFSRIPKLQEELEIPESPYQNLLKTGYELKSIQEDLRKLNNEGQDLVDTLKKAGLDMGAIRKDPKIQEIVGSINKIKSVEQSTKDLYIKEKDRLAKEAEHNAPKNAEEFQKRTEDLGVKYKQLNSEFGQEFLVSTEKLSTLMKKLREDNPEFQYWKTPRYVELARDSSGVSNTEMRAIERKTEQDFTAFAFDKIQKDPELVKFFENSAKRSNQYIGAVAGLEQERKGLQNLMSPKRVGWLKDDASVTAKMWGLVVDNPSFHTIDAAREGGQVSHRMVMERFGLMRGSDFKPTV